MELAKRLIQVLLKEAVNHKQTVSAGTEIVVNPKTVITKDRDKVIEATCTWGDGPDVLLESNHFLITNGKVQVDLTKEEAVNLASSLTQAVNAVRHMESGLLK